MKRLFFRKKKPVAPPKSLQRTVKIMTKTIPIGEQPEEFPIEPEHPPIYYVRYVDRDPDDYRNATAIFNHEPAPTTIRGVLEELDGDASLAEMIKALENAKLI